jgi:hypothetical protein
MLTISSKKFGPFVSARSNGGARTESGPGWSSSDKEMSFYRQRRRIERYTALLTPTTESSSRKLGYAIFYGSVEHTAAARAYWVIDFVADCG